MKPKPLEQLFNAMYHGKHEFSDFISSDINSEYIQSEYKNRTIFKTTKKLKTYHTFLNLFLFEHLGTNKDVVFSYRKGVSSHDAVSKHTQNKYFFQTDISNFFSSICRSLIKETIEAGKTNVPISDIDTHLDRILDLVTIDNALPMGFTTSPMISNTCLFVFDNIFQEFCKQKNLTYTRYSDDIIVSGNNKNEISNIDKSIEEILNNLYAGKFNLNHSKSKYTWKGKKIKILGMVIMPNGEITVDKKFKNEIEVLLHYYKNDRSKFLELEKVGRDIGTGISVISGYLNYINTVDTNYLDKLRKKFGATTIDMFIHQSVK